ncbi:hypothetical protein [Pseudogulbenkiania sp. MAI-1]|uniref:hypothetical protein n=1 Tax=Pseudogulbenkiania sp. MAI-1 TaxID=990370 RepID=UPI00045E9A65|nr:hypothetical protein [Pseudogulbenkiania sp. MAI-1]
MSDIVADILTELRKKALTATELQTRPRLANVPARVLHEALDALVDVGVLQPLAIGLDDRGYLITGTPLSAPADEPAIPSFLLK